jgi:hypothetical protein
MQAAPQFDRDLPEFPPQSLARRPPQHREPSFPSLPANVREAEEVEALGLAQSVPLLLLGRMTAEFDEAGLCGVQLQSELRETLREVGPEPPGFCRRHA